MASLLERFEAKVDREGPEVREGLGPCWLWTASLDNYGYGQISVKVRPGYFRPEHAHRVSYRLWVVDIPAGQVVCHRCDVRACVNPGHLFVGTQRTNLDDMVDKGRSAVIGRSLPDHTEAEIYRLAGEGVEQKAIAERLGVSRAVVCRRLKRAASSA